MGEFGGEEGAEVVGEGLGVFGGSLLAEGGAGGELVGNRVSGSQGVVDHRVEVDEPALEQGSDDAFESAVQPPVALDLVVQRPEDMRNGPLRGNGGGKATQTPRSYPWSVRSWFRLHLPMKAFSPASPARP